jgi:pimeloyl-ACP methyl ester carboxylesterase
MLSIKKVRRRRGTACACLAFVASVVNGVAQTQPVPATLTSIRAVAGTSRSVVWVSERKPLNSISAVSISPPMTFPIRTVIDTSGSTSQLRLTIPPSTPAGEYDVRVTGRDEDGREVSMNVDLRVDSVAVARAASGAVPVILLNGFQSSCAGEDSTLLGSQGTFGMLWKDLQEQGESVVFFNNCVYPNASIESLGAELGAYISSLTYTDGTKVNQVDLVTHSMGGLIARAYLAGLQQSGSLAPPINPHVRKLVEIATPNFGSYVAGDLSFFTGTQDGEMIPGSSFLWSLGRWNQGVDDLRGVDALAIVGNAGKCCSLLSPAWSNASDGVVSVTSASLGFASLGYARDPSRTRLVPYCHTDAIPLPYCSAAPIANVDKAPQTGAIVLSFLADTSVWQSTGTPNQTEYGGVYFALENAAGTHYTALSNVSLGSQSLQSGATNAVFYSEFASGTGTFQAISTANQNTACGPFSVPGGYYSVFRCKFGPMISFVGPFLTSVPGLVVSPGGNVTINGSGFGQQCSGCQVLAYPGPVALQISSWSDSAITTFLPSTFNGITEVVVQATAGSDSITFMSAPAASPSTISLSSTQLQFSYTIGAASPTAQAVTVANSGGGMMTWSAASNVPWMTVSSSSSSLTVSVNPSGLSAGPHLGTVTVSATGASNSPQSISVTLTVTQPVPPPAISLSTNQLQFTCVAGGTRPGPQSVTVSNSGGGTLSWSAVASAAWITVSLSSNSLSISVDPTNLSIGPHSGMIAITATNAPNSPQTISVMLTVSAAVHIKRRPGPIRAALTGPIQSGESGVR